MDGCSGMQQIDIAMQGLKGIKKGLTKPFFNATMPCRSKDVFNLLVEHIFGSDCLYVAC